MALESNIFDWSRTVSGNAPADTDNLNSSSANQYTDLGEMFRDLKQVIRDQSLSHGWGTINNRTYFKNVGTNFATTMMFRRGTTNENHWGNSRTIQIKFSGTNDNKYYVDSASGNGPVPRYLPTGTQFLIYNPGPPIKWLFGYIHKIRTGDDSGTKYLEILPSGLMEYTTASDNIALPEADVGLKPVANYNTALGGIDDNSYMVISNHQGALPSTLNSGQPLENTNLAGSGIGIADPLVQSDDSFATSGSIGNTPYRRQSGTFVVTSGSRLVQGTADTKTGAKILVPFPLPMATSAPPATEYNVFLTPIHSVCKSTAGGNPDLDISPLCYVVKEINRYTTGFTVEFMAELPTSSVYSACIVWKWMVMRDFY
jgi:hypothetical protein